MNIMRKFTEEEKMILNSFEQVESDYCWIARDVDNELYVYNKKPKTLFRQGCYYVNGDGAKMLRLEPFEHIFKGVTFEAGPVQFRK